jgi:hypothetical protein
MDGQSSQLFPLIDPVFNAFDAETIVRIMQQIALQSQYNKKKPKILSCS